MKALTLYEMSDEYQFLVSDLYDYETGVINEKTLERLNNLTDTMQNKCIAITKLFQSIEATQEAIKAEKERLSKRERAFKNQVTRLKEYLQTNMERCDIKKIECAEFAISIQKNPEKLDIYDEGLIPPIYEIMTISLDEAKIKQDLKNGVAVPGARLVQGSSIRIR